MLAQCFCCNQTQCKCDSARITLRCEHLLRAVPSISRHACEGCQSVHVWETKADLSRTVPLTTRAGCAVLAQPAHTWQSPYPGFVHRWAKARAALGLTDDKAYTPHVLHYTCASRLVQAGAGLLHIQTWLGHKQVVMTQRYSQLGYAQLAPHSLRDAANLLERANGQ